MIICRSHNVVVIRPPKTGSTSLLHYFLNSGLVHPKHDSYFLDGEGQYVHKKFKELVVEKHIKGDEPCVATIRNPIERFSSAYHHILAGKETLFVNPNKFLDALYEKNSPIGIKNIAYSQCDYFPEHAELFNTENLHEHVSKYILEKGGKVDKRIEMRKNPDNKLDVFLAGLTPDRKQSILDTYSKDFELWEKAYAVYN